MKNKIYISTKLQELIAFLKKELKEPITILEPKEYERNIPNRIGNPKPINNRADGTFIAYLDQYHAHHRSDYTFQKRSQ